MTKGLMTAVAAALALASCGGGDAPSAEVAQAASLPASRADAGGSGGASAAGEVCRVSGGLQPLPDDVHEASGVAASRAHDGVFWTHNDSGEPELFAVGADGREMGRVRVAGARVEDWEDVSLAPCPGGGDCLYVADIGDNEAARPSITVYRVPEPAPGDAETRPAEAIRLRYPDGPHDAEAMFVLNGAVHVVTKGETGSIAVYRHAGGAATAGQPATLERVRELAAGEVKRADRVTSADASPDGAWVVLRTLESAAFYPARELLGGAAVTPRRVDLRGLNEAQGEGIAFAPGGGVVLTSEGGKKKDPATLARLDCSLE